MRAEWWKRALALTAALAFVAPAGFLAGCGDDDDNGTGPVQPAGAPTNVQAVASGTTITVTWTPGTNATSHRAELTATGETDREETVGATDGTAQFIDLTPGTTYSAQVFSINSGGETGSQVATAQILPVPTPVTVTVATDADEVTVSWTASSNVASYRAELAESGNVLTKTTDATTTQALFAVADGLGDGLTYAATVYAINENGQTASSNTPQVSTNFFPWDEYYVTSLHATGQGKQTFYNESPNNGFERYTQIAYQSLSCKNCHEPAATGGCESCHDTPTPQLGAQVDATLAGPCGNCHGRQKAEAITHGFTDVHRDAGMDCMACHSLGDVHGDGTAYASMLEDGAIDARCETCHGSVSTNSYHSIHGALVDCSACHIQSVVSCYNCHFETEVQADMKVAYGQFKNWKFLMNYRGKVHAANFQSVKWGADPEGRTLVAMAPFYAHTISRNAVTACADCHDNANVQDWTADGVIDVVVWDAGQSRLVPTTGVVPVPPDYLTSMRFDFVDQDQVPAQGGPTGPWQFLETGPDTIQIIYGSPLTASQMSDLQTPF